MVTIDAIELVLGTLGVASSIYDPWVGDPFAPVFVMMARSAGVISLFLAAGLASVGLAATDDLDVDPTTIAVIFFAAGAAAPIIARGVWSIIDMGTMFSDLMCESYKPTDRDGCNGETNTRGFNAEKIELRGVLAWIGAVFSNLMIHNVSFHKLAPYAGDLFRACKDNMEKVIHGKAVYRQNPERGSDWDWSPQGWTSRLKGLLNLLILNAPCGAFLIVQGFATLGESLILAIGSAWIAVSIAAHVNILKENLALRRPNDPVFSPNCSGRRLKRLVEDLICCKTCNHRGDSRNHLTGRSPNENDKQYEEIMPKVRATSVRNRSSPENDSNRNWYHCC